MSDTKPQFKVGDAVDVVAVSTGFLNDRMVYPGTKFQVTATKGKDGQPRLPKWVQPADAEPVKKVERRNGDLKPVDAQAAVKRKAAQLSGEQPPGGGLA